MSKNNDNQKMENSESMEIKNENKLSETEDKSEEKAKPLVKNALIRESLVSTAVHFLLNSRVINSSLIQKQTFLLKKGLSLEEIDLAIDRANALKQTQSLPPIVTNNDNKYTNQLIPSTTTQLMPSFLSRSTNFVATVALLTGFLYGTYVFYKKYIEPLIFEPKEPQKHPFVTIQEQLNQLSIAMTFLQNNVSTIESNIKKQIEEEIKSIKSPEDVSLHELKSELSSIKALLLNRRQFAATPVSSIPLWQLDSNKDSINKSIKVNETNEQMNGSLSNNDLQEENPNSSTDFISSNESNSSIQPIVNYGDNALQD